MRSRWRRDSRSEQFERALGEMTDVYQPAEDGKKTIRELRAGSYHRPPRLGRRPMMAFRFRHRFCCSYLVASAIGLALSVAVHGASLVGSFLSRPRTFSRFTSAFSSSGFRCVILAQRVTRGVRGTSFWKVILSGCPDSMRWLFYALFGLCRRELRFVHDLRRSSAEIGSYRANGARLFRSLDDLLLCCVCDLVLVAQNSRSCSMADDARTAIAFRRSTNIVQIAVLRCRRYVLEGTESAFRSARRSPFNRSDVQVGVGIQRRDHRSRVAGGSASPHPNGLTLFRRFAALATSPRGGGDFFSAVP